MAATPSPPGVASEREQQSSPQPAIEPSRKSHGNSRFYSDDEDHDSPEPSQGKASKSRPKPAPPATGTSAVGKIKHLKKDDGEPLWREDIQYDFLKAVFDDETKVFTNSYEPTLPKQCFADLYIDTMARSSKTSKVLRDKLLSDREAAKGMAMVCLLVNVGRMNTTLNFFPEMRAQLRTYHAIPSLQASADASAYKQLQDAPRLKSILKGASEDRPEPQTLEDLKPLAVPRTNPVSLIFLFCSQASKIADLHFPKDHEFHDVITKTNYNSKSRARAFLWLVYFYLESDFTEEGCEENPFGPGVDYGEGVANQGVPELAELKEGEKENEDTQEEKIFGEEKRQRRINILAADQALANENKRASRGGRLLQGDDSPSAAILPRIRPAKHESDLDSTRSTPPPRSLGRVGFGSSNRRSGPLKYQFFDASSPAGPSSHGAESILPRKPRPPTAHQLAVERNRNQRVEHILDRGLRRERHKLRRKRRHEGVFLRAKSRLEEMSDPLQDSDDDNLRDWAGSVYRQFGLAGLYQLKTEPEDFGEEVDSYAAALRRVGRRLSRWESHVGVPLGVVAPTKRRVRNRIAHDEDGNNNEGAVSPDKSNRQSRVRSNGGANGDIQMEDADDLDDMEKELLGIASGGEGDKDDDDELDDVDKTLLGMAGGDSDSD